MIIETNLIKKGFGAFTVYPFIFIRPDQVDNHGLVTHETVHYLEQKKSWVIPWLLRYWLSKEFRLAAEVRAYKDQMAAGGITLKGALNMLEKYGVDHLITTDTVKELTSP